MRKTSRRLRRTWATRGEVLAWIATRDRRRVADQKGSAEERFIKRKSATDMLAVVNSAFETTYAKGGKDAPELGVAFADAAQALDEHIAAKRVVVYAEDRFRWEEVEDIWRPKRQGRPPVETLDSKLIGRLVGKLMARNRDEYAEAHGGRLNYALCRWRVLREMGVAVREDDKDDKRLIETLFDTALKHGERRSRPATYTAVEMFRVWPVTVQEPDLPTGEPTEDFPTGEPTERQLENLRSWRQKGAPSRRFGI